MGNLFGRFDNNRDAFVNQILALFFAKHLVHINVKAIQSLRDTIAGRANLSDSDGLFKFHSMERNRICGDVKRKSQRTFKRGWVVKKPFQIRLPKRLDFARRSLDLHFTLGELRTKSRDFQLEIFRAVRGNVPGVQMTFVLISGIFSYPQNADRIKGGRGVFLNAEKLGFHADESNRFCGFVKLFFRKVGKNSVLVRGE